MGKNVVIVLVLLAVCFGGYTVYGQIQTKNSKADILNALSSEYGYSIPPYNIDISLGTSFKTATAKVSASNSPSPTQTWDIELQKSGTSWSRTAEQQKKDNSELDLFTSMGNKAMASGVNPNAEVSNDIKFVYMVVKYKYPKYFK